MRCFRRSEGKGAWLNGRQIHVSKTATLQESLTATGFPSQKRHESPNVHFYQEITLRSHGVRRAGSAALDLAYVACGRLDGFWEFNLNPWDTSAGYLLVEEAGGTVTHFDGGKFTLDSREVLATNGLIQGGDGASVYGDVCGAGVGGDSYAGGVCGRRWRRSRVRKRRTARVMLFDEAGVILLIRFVVQRADGEFVFWACRVGRLRRVRRRLRRLRGRCGRSLGLRWR